MDRIMVFHDCNAISAAWLSVIARMRAPQSLAVWQARTQLGHRLIKHRACGDNVIATGEQNIIGHIIKQISFHIKNTPLFYHR